MKLNLFRACAFVGVLGAFVACSDNSTLSPKNGVTPGQRPSYSETTPFNGPGVCMANDAVAAPTGTISGVKNGDDPLTATNCTSNDVSVAQANLISYQVTDANGNFLPPVTFHQGDVVTCIAGSPIKLNLSANLVETASSARSDIGIWIATDGGNAITGACNHYNLTTNPLLAGSTNPDGDHCADIDAGGAVDNFPLGVIDAVCQTSGPTSVNLHVGSCLGWKEPGGDTVCPLASQGETPNGYRWGTLFANKSKCNCAGFDVPITVEQKAKLEVVKACTPANDPGTFDLLIDNSTTVNAVVVGDNKTCGTGTGAQNLSAGTNVSPGAVHSFGEGDFTTTNYTSSYSCVNRVATGPQHVFTASGDAPATGSSLGPNQITLEPNEDVVCTYTNVRNKGKIELVKSLSPTTDPGLFNLFIKSGATTVASASNVGNNGTTGAGGTQLNIGTYNLSETAGTGTALTDYTTTGPVCVNRVGGGSVTVTSGNVDLLTNADIVCTITNTRNPGKLELIKALSPTTDPGLFNLFIKSGATTVASASNIGNNGTTGAGGTSLAPGTYNLSETAGTGTVLTDYTTTGPVCVNRVGGGSVTVTSGNVSLLSNADVVCTITNTRNVGKLELIKSLSPTTDPGLFNLFIKSGATTVASASNVGNNGTTGAGGTTLNTGTYNLSETAGTGTALADYTTTGPVCVNRVGGGSVTVTSGNVTLAAGADVVCTITNTRNPGKLELRKSLSPTTDPGLFNLFIKSGATTVASASNIGNNGTTGAGGTSLAPGTYNLSETAGTGTVLTDYTTTGPVCVNRVGGGSVTVTSGNVSLLSNADVVCTITNTRNPGKLELIKALSPTTDPGLFNLFIKSGATTVASASNVGNNGTTGAGGTTLAVGTYNLSETAGTGTVLTDYTTSGPVCVNRVGGGSVTVTSGNVNLVSNADVVCTITNTRNGGKLELIKALSPTTDPGLFNLFIKSGATTVASASNVGNNGTTGAGGTALAPGTYGLSETAGTGTALTDYTTTGPVCVNRVGGGSVTVTSGNVNLVSNADVVCTITNTRNPGKLELIKALSPTTDPGLFNLFIKSGATTVASASNVGNNGTTGAGGTSLAPGTYNLSETAGTGTVLTNYTTTGPVCVNRVGGGSVTVTSGNVSLLSNADVVCTITNTRNTGKLELKKALLPTTSPGRFNLFIKSGATTVASATNVGDGGTTGAGGTTLNTGTYNLSETAGTVPVTSLADYIVSAAVCVNRVGGGSVTVTSGNVALINGADVVCTITNTELSTIIIEKEVIGGGTQSFTFTRTLSGGGADLGDNPAPTLQNGGSSSSGKKLVATNYKVCETNLPVGWSVAAAGYTLVGDGLGNFCATFALGAGETKTIHFVNTPPPGGGTRTIGYWKNWSSCAQSNGGQYTKAIAAGHPEQTLDGHLGAGSSIYPIGLITSLTCNQAVNLLAKNAIDGTKRAGDPIYNMVAQLLGAKLNLDAGAGTCSALTTALGQAQTLLLGITPQFDGTGSYKGTLTAAQQALANSLNTTLTAYNEGTLGGGCPSHII